MAAEKKIAESTAVKEEKTAENVQKEKTAEKPSAKKTAVKKAAGEKTIKKSVKPADAKAEKNVKKEQSPRSRKAAEKSLDNVTTALWKKFKDIDVSNIRETIAVQVIVYDLGTFFIAIKEDGEKHIIQAVYNDRDGTLETSYDEIIKMAAGGYDYLNAIINGNINYQGDIKKALTLSGFFK